jgi:hypothetical protein
MTRLPIGPLSLRSATGDRRPPADRAAPPAAYRGPRHARRAPPAPIATLWLLGVLGGAASCTEPTGASPGAVGDEALVGVEAAPPPVIIVTNQFDFEAGRITVFPVGASGDVTPLRTLVGPSTTLVWPEGVTVASDQIIVCDAFTHAIDFFPLAASGNIAPTRRIIGDQTEIDETCIDVAVVNDELYVMKFNELLVFPASASGNVKPSRRVTGFQVGQNLAIDNNELYVTDMNAPGVFVFSLPVADAASPARFISSPCPTGVAAGDGELFVVDGCDSHINVYPETANGDVPPLRTFGSVNMGIMGPVGMTRFRNLLYIADVWVDKIWTFRDTATGNAPPHITIDGPHTGVVNPISVTIH